MGTTLKKLLALTLCAAMALSLFAACGKKDSTNTDTKDPTFDYSVVSGVIMVNTGALFSIRYDVSGNVSGITGDNDAGVAIMESYNTYEGKAAIQVIKELILLSSKAKALDENVYTLLIQISSGTVFNSEEKRNEMMKAAQEALTEVGSKAIPMIIDEENLTGTGYLTLATVKSLLMNMLGVDAFDAFYGDTLPVNNYYLVTVELKGVQYSYTVDAFYGFIAEADQEDLLGDEDFYDDMVEEPADDVVEEPTYDEPVEEEEDDIEIPID